MNKKILAIVMVLALLFGQLAACSQVEELTSDAVGGTDTEGQAKLKVVASIFPQYDFLRAIGGDLIDLKMLLSPGAEAHGFEPTPKDIIDITESDLLVYVGGGSDSWVDQLIKDHADDLKMVAITDYVETMPGDHDHDHEHEDADHDHDHDHEHEDADHDHDHDHEHEDADHDHDHDHEHEDADHDHDHDHEHEDADHDHDHDHEHEDADQDHDHDHEHEDADHDHDHDHEHHHHHHAIDEHVWTDPQNAIKIIQGLTQVLAELDPGHQAEFEANAKAYTDQLAKLDQEFKDLFASAKRKTIVVGDRFPFNYFVKAYGLDYHAAYSGCSTEGDANPKVLAEMVDLVKAEEIPVVFHIELSNQKMAESIADATGAKVLLLHGAHNLSKEDFESGLTYLEIMQNNLENLKVALND